MILVLFSINSFSQQNLNTNISWNAQRPFSKESDIVAATTTQDAVYSTQFIDGFGRPVETNIKQSSPSGLDQIQFHVYDATGRETQQYLPFTYNNGGSFIAVSSAQSSQSSFYQGIYTGEGNFYGKTDFENSPLNRPSKVYGPGNNYVGALRGVTTQYLVNNAAENVKIWNISTAQGSLPTNSSTYPTGQLYKTITTNEQGIQNIEYKNTDGQVILKKVRFSAALDQGSSSGSTHTGFLCTYYVYDDYSNLRFVITPTVVHIMDSLNNWAITQAQSDNLCYRTEYDLFNRPIIKKDPGSGEKWVVYDQRGRIVMRQDINLRNQQKWEYIQYDNLDRVTTTGLMTDPNNYNNLSYHQGLAINSTAYPTISNYTIEQLSQSYYDNYNWATGVGLPATIDASQASNSTYFLTASNSSYPFPQTIAQTPLTRGMQTGTKVEILGKGTYLYSEIFYDNKGRSVQTQQTNITGGIDESTNQYSWSGLLLRNLLQHVYKGSSGTQTHIILTINSYDPLGRISNTTKTIFSSLANGTRINSSAITIATYNYDELGRKKIENLGVQSGSNIPLETRQYDYNVRGWLLGVNRAYVQNTGSSTNSLNTGENFTTPNSPSAGNLFGFDIGYDNQQNNLPGSGYAAVQYGGNATGTTWKSDYDGEIRKYDYTYDYAGRLTGAAFTQFQQNVGFNNSAGIDYSVSGISYDYNGNLVSMTQKGLANILATQSVVIDQLQYIYNPLNGAPTNQLSYVTDTASAHPGLGDFTQLTTGTNNAYSYDANGNIISDANRIINNIHYNYINLPDSISFTANAYIRYVYDAMGNKLQKIINNNSTGTSIITTINYVAEFEYRNDTMLFVVHEQGRSRINSYNGSTYYTFDYYLKDQLGSVRMVITDDPNSSLILEAMNYYPMGLAMKWLDKTQNLSTHNYFGFQGKEMQNMEFGSSGLEEYDFSARYYDQQLGIWHNPDPAGQFISPYLAMGNNWSNGIDPSGKNFWRWAFAILDPIGYIGASLESNGNWNPDNWNKDWLKGGITADIIAASVFVGVTDMTTPAILTNTLGLGAAGTNIAVGASIGVAQNVGSQLLQDGGKWNWDNEFAASVSGAISGAFQSGYMQAKIDDSWWHLGSAESNPYGGWFSGVTSDVVGSVLSTSAKTAIMGGHWFDNVLVNSAQNAFGQIAHNFVSSGATFGDNGNNADGAPKVQNWVDGIWTENNHSNFATNAIFNFSTNTVSALFQQIFTGNLFNPHPFAGSFDGSSLLSNLFPNTYSGWLSDQFNSWNP
jgi:RHS repeat-associated protein